MKIYSGVGARKTPREVGLLMEDIAEKLAKDGWTLRSGGTGTAIKISEMHGIPVFNLAIKKDLERIKKWL